MIERIKNLLTWKQNKENSKAAPDLDKLFESLNKDSIRIEIGADIAFFGENLSKSITGLREELKESTGFIIPLIHIVNNSTLQENQYSIFIREKNIFEDFIIPNEETCLKEIPEKIKQICFDNIDDVFTNELLENYIKTVQNKNSWLVWDITNKISLFGLKTILSELIKKDISINNINYIFEKINETIEIDYDTCKKTDPYKIVRRLSAQLD